jgi:hypothetical protein
LATLIIGFGYKARRGKDTAAKAILEARGGDGTLDIRRYSFAKALKQEVNGLYESFRDWEGVFGYCYGELGMPHAFAREGSPDLSDPDSPYGKQRFLLQWWGTEYRRAQDPDYWVKRLAEQISWDKPEVALITDMRFQNEARWVISRGGITVKVDRPDYEDQAINTQHASECELDGFHFDVELQAGSGQMDLLRGEALLMFDALRVGVIVGARLGVSEGKEVLTA